MNLPSFSIAKKLGIGLLLLILPTCGVAHAQSVSGSISGGQFNAASGTNIRGVGTDRLEWSAINNINESSLTFTAGSAFSTAVDTPFSIGTLTFVNRLNPLANLDVASLRTTVIFTQPLSAGTQQFTFDLDIDKNFLLPDTAEFTLGSLNNVYSMGTSGYTLRLLGFQSTGGFSSTLAVPDGQTRTGSIYVQVSGPTAVPEPGEYAVMGMAGLTVCGLMMRARRTRVNKA